MLDVQDHTFSHDAYQTVADEAVEFFLATSALFLPPDKFLGAGVYALYYVGDFSAYQPLARLTAETFDHPIYVGKADPPGGRTGAGSKGDHAKLHGRLKEHARSIARGAGLELDHFRCRIMIMDEGTLSLISTVESKLISKYAPLWNRDVDGFGNHAPGKGRNDQAPSEWDSLHPGRAWAERLTGVLPSKSAIESKIRERLSRLS